MQVQSGFFTYLTHCKVSLVVLPTTVLVTCNSFSINNLESFTFQFTGIFIAETSHASVRRMLGPFQIIGLSFGELLSYMLPAFLPWRLSKLILSQVVCLPATFAILLCEETPHWLVKKGRLDEAEYVT